MMNFTPFPDLSTERLLLRQMNMEDEKAVFALRSDDSIIEFTGIQKAVTIQDAREFIEKISKAIRMNESIFWAITLKGSKDLIGTICLWNLDKDDAVADIGYMLLPQFHRRGIMQEAFAKVVEYGFEKMQLYNIDAEVEPANIASVIILEKNGFVLNKRLSNSVIYSLQNNR